MSVWTRRAAGLVLATDAALWWSGAMGPRGALVLAVTVELPLLMAVVVGYVRHYRAVRARGEEPREAWRLLVESDPLLRVTAVELGALTSLARWVLRRPDVPAGAVGLSSGRGSTAVPVAFAVVGAVELVVVHVLVPWPLVRTVLDVVGVYGLLAVLGLAARRVVRPHLLTDTELVLRTDGRICARLHRDDVEALVPDRRLSPVSAAVEDTGDGTRALCLPGVDGTHVTRRTAGALAVMVPTWPWSASEVVDVAEVRLASDDESRRLLAEWVGVNPAPAGGAGSGRPPARGRPSPRRRPRRASPGS